MTTKYAPKEVPEIAEISGGTLDKLATHGVNCVFFLRWA